MHCIVIVLERPGYGDSSILSIEYVADWNGIFAQVINALNIQSAIAVGCSAGAVYAYATAFAFPDIITHVWVLDGVPAVFLETVIRHYSRDDQVTYNRFLVSPIAEIQDDYAKKLKAFAEQQFDTSEPYIINTLKDGCANHYIGMARESQLQIRPWGFDISAVQQPVTLWHAENDAMVPYNAAREMTHVLPNGTLVTAKDLGTEQNIHSESISQGFLHLLKQL